MVIHVKQACEFVNKDGAKFNCAKDFIGIPPVWVENDDYFKLLCGAGLITAHIDNKSVDENMKKEESSRKRK